MYSEGTNRKQTYLATNYFADLRGPSTSIEAFLFQGI